MFFLIIYLIWYSLSSLLYILSSSVSISIYSFCFKIFYNFINEEVASTQKFHSSKRGKFCLLSISAPSLRDYHVLELQKQHTERRFCKPKTRFLAVLVLV